MPLNPGQAGRDKDKAIQHPPDIPSSPPHQCNPMVSLHAPTESQHHNRNSRERCHMPISLPNAVVGQVVTRFPPEPSWLLDLGHCKASLMNQFIATQFQVSAEVACRCAACSSTAESS